MLRRCSIVIRNHVQLVGFRGFVESLALRHNLAGFVYNDYTDGTVKVVCEGDSKEIDGLVEDIKSSNPEVSIRIEDRIILPRPLSRVIVNLDREIHDRLDKGVNILKDMRGDLSGIKEGLGGVREDLKDVRGDLSGIKGDTSQISQIVAGQDRVATILERIEKLLERE